MAYSKRNGIDKALDQVDRVLENLEKKQIRRKPQENKSVQCQSSEKSTKEIVKKSRRPRGVLLTRCPSKTGQIKQDTISKHNKRTLENNTRDEVVLSSTPNVSKTTHKNSHNFTSISHISYIAPQNKKKLKRKRIKRINENSSTDEEISRCYLQRVENHTSKKQVENDTPKNVSTKTIKKTKSSYMRYIDKENKKKSNREKIQVPSESSKSRISTHAEPTQSSINRMLLTEKIPKQQDYILPYVPVGKQSGSHNCGVQIQQEIGKLNLDPKTVLSWNEKQDLIKQNSDMNVNICNKREGKECPHLCQEEIYRALKNINKEISEFIVKSV